VIVDQDRLHHLKQDAKWASSVENQIKAVRELGTMGEVALPSLEEVMQISVRDEIKQCCVEAIRELGRNNKTEDAQQKKKAPRVKRVRRKSKSSAR
jgi:hypothetical protein